jgi:hypothetical protein
MLSDSINSKPLLTKKQRNWKKSVKLSLCKPWGHVRGEGGGGSCIAQILNLGTTGSKWPHWPANLYNSEKHSYLQHNKYLSGQMQHISTGRPHMMVIYSTSFVDEETRAYTNCDNLNESVQQKCRLHFPLQIHVHEETQRNNHFANSYTVYIKRKRRAQDTRSRIWRHTTCLWQKS